MMYTRGGIGKRDEVLGRVLCIRAIFINIRPDFLFSFFSFSFFLLLFLFQSYKKSTH